MTVPLFRSQAVAARANQREGRTSVVTPPSAWYVTVLLVVILAASVLFLVNTGYARKETVVGVIEAGPGIKRVYSPGSGIIDRIHVKVGQTVTKGEPIATFRVNPAVAGDSRETTIAEYDRQLAATKRRIEQLNQEYSEQLTEIDTERDRLTFTRQHTVKIRDLQRKKVIQQSSTHDAALPLYRSGHLSRIEWGRIAETLLNARQQAAQFDSDLSAIDSELARLAITRNKFAASHAQRVLILEQETSRIEQARIAFVGQSGFSVPAPVSGRIANVFLDAGILAGPHEPIVSIREPGQLRAKLWIPSRSAGFIETGLPVNLLYDAFPYQQFGSHSGRVTSLSNHALMPGDVNNLDIREPVFEAIIAIQSDTLSAYGAQVPLRSGMTLKADIVLDRRSLLDWLLEPLFARRGRS